MTDSMLLFDMDGTMCDFDGYYTTLTGLSWAMRAHQTHEEKWAALDPFPNFFRDMPPMPGMVELWNQLQPLHPGILSAATLDTADQTCRQQKLEWIRRHLDPHGELGDRVVIVNHWSEKPLYCRPGDTLIDDYERNRAGWEAAGGQFILFEGVGQLVRELVERNLITDPLDNQSALCHT